MTELVMGATGQGILARPRREQYLLEKCILFRVLFPGWALESFNAWHTDCQVDLLLVSLAEGVGGAQKGIASENTRSALCVAHDARAWRTHSKACFATAALYARSRR